jgi:REP element-mobilizing transposase RayT
MKGYDYSRRGMYFITICTYEREHLFGEIQNGVLCHNTQALLATTYWNDITNHYPEIIPHEFIAMPKHVHGIIEMAPEPETTDNVAVGARFIAPWSEDTPEPAVGARFIAPLPGIRNAQPHGTQTRDALNRDVQTYDTLNRNTQPRNTVDRNTQPHGAQNHGTQPRDAQPRNAQPHDTQPYGTKNQGTQNQGAINRAPTGGVTGNNNPMLHNDLGRIIRWYKGRVTFECRRRNLPFVWQRNYYEHIIRDRHDHASIADYISNNPANWLEDRFYGGEPQL